MSEDPKKSLGEFLKSERERRGLTIEQTSSATKIGLKVLKQLEADQYVDLPALPFVRGFVRNYGKFLGLDGDKLLTEYAVFLETHASERPRRDAGHSGYAFERPEGEQSRKILWGIMASLLIFGGTVVFLFKPSLKRKHHGHIDKLKAGGGDSQSGDATPLPEASGTPVVAASGTPVPVASGVAPIATASPTPAHSPTHSPTVIATSIPSPSPTVPEKPFVPPKSPVVLAPSPAPAPIPSPAPSLAPPPTPSPTATGEVKPEDELKKDPLQSGANYPPKEIRTKIILRTRADVWVRYRCDDKKLMKFALKKDKILVLRGKNSVYLQVSNPDSITIQPSGSAEVLYSQNAEAFEFRGNLTVAYPPQAREKIEEIFKIGPKLPFTDSPPQAQ